MPGGARARRRRAAFLASACGGDSGLRRDVEALLAKESAAAGFLSTPLAALAAEAIGASSDASLVGRRVGSYEMLAALGAGGMGVVYRARDIELGRDVAIKVLPRAFVADRDRLARFEREARVLASLNHPNIGAIYGSGHSLLAAPFDLHRLTLTTAPVRLIEDVAGDLRSGVLKFSLSPAGTLVYEARPSRADRALVWVDRSGAETPLPISPRAFASPRVSPDGQRLAFALADGERRDIWVYDVAADQLTRVTHEHDNEAPLWTPDGRRLTYTSIYDGRQFLVWQAADGTGSPEILVSSQDELLPGAWTPDGRTLLYVATPPTDWSEILLLPLDGDDELRPRHLNVIVNWMDELVRRVPMTPLIQDHDGRTIRP